MPFASGHLIGGYITARIYQRLSRIRIPHLAWFFILLGAILPDIDFLLEWLFKIDTHRLFTHSLLFLLTAPLAIYLILYLLKEPHFKIIAIAFALGIFSHLFLDLFSSQGIPLLYPHPLNFSITGPHYFDRSTPSILDQEISGLKTSLELAILDMAMGTAFLFYLWWKKEFQPSAS